jgi:hypothetical protein
MSDYMESLFKGIEVIVDKKLETLSYDTTEICTIINSNDCKNGRYRVSNGNLSYIAYSDNDGFRNGEQVRVNIPKGDMT